MQKLNSFIQPSFIPVCPAWTSNIRVVILVIHSHPGVWQSSLDTLTVCSLSAPRTVCMHQSEFSHMITGAVTDFWSMRHIEVEMRMLPTRAKRITVTEATAEVTVEGGSVDKL